jgi:magnesium chelatase accessory protein
MGKPLNWDTDGKDWPHREASQFVQAGGMRWHIQQFAKQPAQTDPGLPAPLVMLIHGTGSSTHSWRDVVGQLRHEFSVLAIDLPGHGFSELPPSGVRAAQLSLDGMAKALGRLLATLHLSPTLVVGHSAGAAIALRMCLDGLIAPQMVVSLNGALLPFSGLAGRLFPPVAKLMSVVPGVPRFFSWCADDPAMVKKMIEGTGSVIDAKGLALYARLVRSPAHSTGVLGMMANWDLDALERDLPKLTTRVLQVVGANDQMVSPDLANRVNEVLPTGSRLPIVRLPGLGHLAHEEQAELVALRILESFHSLFPRTD